MGISNFNLYFRSSKLLNFDKNVAEISLQNPYIKNLVEGRYYALIKRALDRQTAGECSLVFSALKTRREKKENQKRGKEKAESKPLFEERKEGDKARQAAERAELNPDFTFKTFCVSTTNQLAHAAAMGVANSPGQAYNPLYLYGGVGVGKTHLMQAVGHAVCQKNPGKKICYISAETFLNEFVDSLQTKTTSNFKKKYREVDVLLIDDIQFISGKEGIQEEFFHTFNTLQKKKAQIVFTSDRTPQEIKKLAGRLRSRFEGGLVADIQQPDFELKTAVALTKAKLKGVELPRDVASVIASNVENIRTLEGILTRLLTEAKLKNEKLTPEFAAEVIGAKINEEENGATQPEKIISAVVGYYGLRVKDIKGERRHRTVVMPRQVLMYLLKNKAQMTYQQIGNTLGGRDHSTVIHGVDKIKLALGEDENLRNDLAEIKAQL